MDKDIEFLNYIYQNSKMGVITINKLHESIRDNDMIEVLKKQLEQYEEICNEAIKLFISYGKKEKDINSFVKTMSTMMIDFKDKSTSNVAKMMMEGSNKGIIEITEKINHYEFCDKKILKLANKLLDTEEANLEEMKKYL